MDKNRDIILDLYLINKKKEIFVIDRPADDSLFPEKLTIPILYLPFQKHPIDEIKEYISSKGLAVKSIRMLPMIALNKFDTEIKKDYLVLSFLINVYKSGKNIKNEKWISLEELYNSKKLIPEFNANNFKSIINGDQRFYEGLYKESDGSNDVLSLKEIDIA